MKKVLYLICITALAMMWSCSGKEKKALKSYAEAEEEFVSSISEADSTGVIALCDEFMENVKTGDLNTAVGMLYELDMKNATLSPISDDRANAVTGFFEAFPVQSYKLNYMAFSIASLNDVKYDIVFGEDKNGNVKTTSFTLNPVYKDGEWYLCVKQNDMKSKTVAEPIDPRTAVGFKKQN